MISVLITAIFMVLLVVIGYAAVTFVRKLHSTNEVKKEDDDNT